MRHPLQQYSRKIVILLLEALVIGALLAFAFFLKPENQPVQQPLPAQPRVAKIPSPPAMISDTATTVLELFNPSDQSLTHQLNETTIRQQIEQIMATNYVLANCHLIDAESYRNSFRALIVYAQRTKFADSWVTAEEKVRSIAESASASYSLLYYRTKCDDPKLAQTTRQLIDWQNAYLDQ